MDLFGDNDGYDYYREWDFGYNDDDQPSSPKPRRRRCADKNDEFMNAIVEENYDKARHLIAFIDFNATDEDGETPLTWAAYRNLTQTASMLINGGADINRTNGDGWSALLGAASQGHVSMCRLLLASRADANLSTKQGNTPLHMAAWKGHHDTVRLLLESNTLHVDVINKMQQTALMLAAKHGNHSVVDVMVYSAASLDLKSPPIEKGSDPKDGITAAYHAIRGVDEKSLRLNAACLETLIAFGASDADLEAKIDRFYTLSYKTALKQALINGRRQRAEAPQKLRIELLRLPSSPLLRDLCNIVIGYVLGII